MRGLQKSKRVSWASDLNLCQVKLFLSDESPSLVGVGGQDHLQAKDSWHSAGSGSDDNLPPGFEAIQPANANAFQNKLSQIPLLHWKCPSRFVLDPNWQVAAGEESKELEFESQREMRVLEAVYPRPSAIPPNPASPMGDPYHNDHQTPIIPITPIEDEDMPPVTATSSSTPAPTTTNNLPPPGMVPGVEPDVVSAAYSALTTAMSNTSQGNLIDPNLLIKILSNPTLIEKLVSNHAPSGSSQPVSQPPPFTTTLPPPEPPLPRPPHLPSGGSHFPPPNRVGPVSIPVPVSSVAPQSEVNLAGKKDINYYKSLIQQHGGEKLENSNNNNNGNNNNNNQKTRGDVKPKMTKACIYFNSTRGCRHGANCVFQHDSASSTQQQQQRVSNSNGNSNLAEGQNAKRMKMDREITGT